MPRGAKTLDTEALAYWIAVRGTNCRRLERALDLSNGTVGKFLNGQTGSMAGESFLAIAEHLGVPLDAILTARAGRAPERRRGAWIVRSPVDPDHDRETMREYAEVCALARVHWTIHRNVNSYLKHPDHFMSDERAVARALRGRDTDADDYVQRAGEFQTLMRAAHGTGRSNADHWVVTQEAAFAGVENPEWVEETVRRVQEFGLSAGDGRLVISMLPARAFADLDRRVSDVLGSRGWIAANLIDGRYALVQTDPYHTMTCYDPGTVARLMRLLRAAVHAVDPDFPAPGEGAQRRMYVTRRTRDFLVRKEGQVRHR